MIRAVQMRASTVDAGEKGKALKEPRKSRVRNRRVISRCQGGEQFGQSKGYKMPMWNSSAAEWRRDPIVRLADEASQRKG